MSKVTRFTVSLEEEVLSRFDEHIASEGYPTRSKAIGDLIRMSLVTQEWESGSEVAAAIVMVYDHHKRDLSHKLTHVQHDHHHMIISTQHIHLDHDNCLEIVVVRGKSEQVQRLAGKLRGIKGVKYASVAAASTGAGL